jgi:manganese/iron transport system permease protein
VLYRLLVEPFALPFMRRALVEALLLGAVAGLVSVFVLLRRLAFFADALTHCVFPGVVLGFLVAGTGGIVWGALLFAVLTAVLLTVLTTNRRLTEDATLAILLTGLFSVGVVLVSRRSSYSADLTAFLFGRILYVDSRQVAETAVVAAAVTTVLLLVGKELVLRAFDPGAAAGLGYRVPVLDLVLNVLVALVIVAAVKAVGTVLVIALLVVPAAAARVLTDRLAVLFPVAAGVGALAGWLGLAASYEASVYHGLRLASGASVVLVLTGLYLLTHLGAALRSGIRLGRTAPPTRPGRPAGLAGSRGPAGPTRPADPAGAG